jgi:hypothetical protein
MTIMQHAAYHKLRKAKWPIWVSFVVARSLQYVNHPEKWDDRSLNCCAEMVATGWTMTGAIKFKGAFMTVGPS